ALKDPLADALGGIPPGIFGFVDKELEGFRRVNITPVFVFQGMTPGPKHSMFVNRMDQQMMDAWALLASGHNNEAQKFFAVSTSRINGDFVHFIFQHMRHRGCEVLQAPYFAGTQLVHFAENGVVQAVFGPPGLLLFGLNKAIVNIDFNTSGFDWIDLDRILNKWSPAMHWKIFLRALVFGSMTRDQFVDACMLAGTEYCLTFPLVSWMQTFPTEEVKVRACKLQCMEDRVIPDALEADHLEGKLLIQHSPVYHVHENAVRPSGFGNMLAVPNDYSMVLGDPYFLIFSGILSSKLPQALAKGEWLDKYQPLVDTVEYRQLLSDLSDYRQRALGLIARHLPPYFRNKRILCKAFWENLQNRRSSDPGWTRRCHFFLHRLEDLIRWNINSRNIAQEMQRQRVSKVDFKFCLAWHTNEYLNGGPLIKDLNRRIPEDEKGDDTKAVSAIVHFMLLEHLGLIADDGGMTVLGDVLKDSPTYLQEPCLVALELMKFGLLSGDPFEAAERPFPEQVGYPKQSVDGTTKSILLLARAMSLVPMKLKSGMWNADVDFDLAAFHSLVRLVKRALRHLAEASLVSVLLKNLQRVNLLPQGLLCAAAPDDDGEGHGIMPTFMLPRACMGIVCLFFLKFQGSFKSFTRELYAKFPCCIQPLEDLSTAFRFWEDLKRCVLAIAEPLGAQELADDMEEASKLLAHQRQELGLFD
ncbi:EXO1, partial [Symbiodinium sp. KB8]